jgi:N-methylhydantoinase B
MTIAPPGLGVQDRVLLDVFANRFQALSEEMAHVIQRTGFTVYVKESQDYAASMITPTGETVSFAQRLGTALTQASMKEALDAAAPYAPGDIVIANDPTTSGGLCTHLPDVYLWKPIFWKGEIVAFFCCFIHATDVGGRVAGSVSPKSTEIYQEGLRLPPSKLYSAGVLNEALLKVYLLNTRIPNLNWGDLKALMAGMNTAEERLTQMIERYGLDTVKRGMADVLAYAEESARATIATIPNGQYQFVDLVDDDMVSTRPVRIELNMTVNDGDIVFDFTGTDYEVRSAINIPIYGKMHQFVAHPFMMYMRTTNQSAPLNGGMLRPLKIVAETGSILHPGPNAATGVRMATVFRVQDTIFGALSEATDGILPAAPAGQVSIPLCSVPNLQTGGAKVSQIEPLLGGSGARPDQDGIDGRGLSVGSGLANVPAEQLEVDMPVIMRSFGLVKDSGAPGQYRGGLAVHVMFETLSPGTVVTARGMERYRFRPWGVKGGFPGTLGDTLIYPGTPKEAHIGKIDILNLDPGDMIRFSSPSGGGYGDPLERDPALVLDDIQRGLVSEAAALDVYGVVIVNGAVDEAATQDRRAQDAVGRERPAIDFGPERARYDAIWPLETRQTFRSILSGLSPTLRPYVSELIYRRVSDDVEAGRTITQAAIQQAWEGVRDLMHLDEPGTAAIDDSTSA